MSPITIGTAYAFVSLFDEAREYTATFTMTIENVDRGVVLHEDTGLSELEPLQTKSYFVTESSQGTDLTGDSIEFSVENLTFTDSTGTEFSSAPAGVSMRLSHGLVAEGAHTHQPDPGTIETFEELSESGETEVASFPSNISVSVNDQSPISVGAGDGATTFAETVDITGLLEPGEVNEIRVSSDSLGNMQVWVEGDVYRQISGGG